MTQPPYLTDAELAEICEPLVAPSAQIRYLKSLGMIVHRKPNGKPLIARAEFERVLVGRSSKLPPVRPGSQPNREALLELLAKRKPAGQKKPLAEPAGDGLPARAPKSPQG